MRCQPASPCGGFLGHRKPLVRPQSAAPARPPRASDLLQTATSDRRPRPRAPPPPCGHRPSKVFCDAPWRPSFRIDHSRRPKSRIRMHLGQSRGKGRQVAVSSFAMKATRRRHGLPAATTTSLSRCCGVEPVCTTSDNRQFRCSAEDARLVPQAAVSRCDKVRGRMLDSFDHLVSLDEQ